VGQQLGVRSATGPPQPVAARRELEATSPSCLEIWTTVPPWFDWDE